MNKNKMNFNNNNFLKNQVKLIFKFKNKKID